MMTTYTRRGPGQSYLKSVLSEKINNLIEQKNLNLQINPLKVKFIITTIVIKKKKNLTHLKFLGTRRNY